MLPSFNGTKSLSPQVVYIVERRAVFRQLNSLSEPSLDLQPHEPKISYLDNAYVDEQQAYAAAIRIQIEELEELGSFVTSNCRKIAAQSTMSLKERLRSINKEVDVAAEAHDDPEAPVVKFGVLQFGLAPVRPFQESELLGGLVFQSESDDVEAEDEEDDEEGEEEEDEEDGEEVDEEVEVEDQEEEGGGGGGGGAGGGQQAEADIVGGDDHEEGEEEEEDDEEDVEEDEDADEVDDEEEDPAEAPLLKKQKT